jgi:hypothetical protein
MRCHHHTFGTQQLQQHCYHLAVGSPLRNNALNTQQVSATTATANMQLIAEVFGCGKAVQHTYLSW